MSKPLTSYDLNTARTKSTSSWQCRWLPGAAVAERLTVTGVTDEIHAFLERESLSTDYAAIDTGGHAAVPLFATATAVLRRQVARAPAAGE